jgi:hypothetical protein
MRSGSISPPYLTSALDGGDSNSDPSVDQPQPVAIPTAIQYALRRSGSHQSAEEYFITLKQMSKRGGGGEAGEGRFV